MEFDKNRVYTAVNADELKIGSKCYFADTLKTLQRYIVQDSGLVGILTSVNDEDCSARFFDGDRSWNLAYLISEPKEKQYRPFKDSNELIECWERKVYIPTVKLEKSKLYIQSIWVRSKEYGTDNLIIAYDSDNKSIGGSCVFIQDIWVDMKELFEKFTFTDDSPCGVED